MKLVPIIKSHFVANGKIYGWSAAPLALTATLLGLSDAWERKVAASTQDVKRWPSVVARVVDSKVEEVEMADGKIRAKELRVSARFSFDYKGEAILADYVAKWHRSDEQNWVAFLAQDARISIRVSPEEPSRISLLDHNGVP